MAALGEVIQAHHPYEVPECLGGPCRKLPALLFAMD